MQTEILNELNNKIIKQIQEENIQFIDLRFTDTLGTEQHMTLLADQVDDALLTQGKLFDGSSIRGWCDINNSDMVLKLRCGTAKLDPFFEEKTLIIRCDVYDPKTNSPYSRCPRSIATRAEQYLKTTNIADTCYFGPELEFFLLDDVRWNISMEQVYFQVNSTEAAWNSATNYPHGNDGYRPTIKGGYCPLPPIDSSHNIRAMMCQVLKSMGQVVELHHHEVATSNQNEIGTRFGTLLDKADDVQEFKYVIKNVAKSFNKAATFMPKPLVGDNGSGMHCHQSLFLNGKNLFNGNEYAKLSKTALYYIGGIIKHAKALNAFTNPTTNSYKRLVPGFEAPEFLTYSQSNRSAAIRIPFDLTNKSARIEVRFPDPAANPYLAFSALMMAGIDGVLNKIEPTSPCDEDLFSNTPHNLPTVARSLEHALEALEQDYEFLCKGGVFSTDFIQSYIKLKQEEILKLRCITHPVEFELYWSC